MGAIINVVLWVLNKLFGKASAPSQEAQQAAKAAASDTRAQGAENAVVELKEAAAARAAADAVRLRSEGTGSSTVDPDAAINRIDAEDRRD